MNHTWKKVNPGTFTLITSLNKTVFDLVVCEKCNILAIIDKYRKSDNDLTDTTCEEFNKIIKSISE